MPKKKKMDKLSKEASMALAAGMSYGKWKAMQTPVKIVPVVQEHFCLNCGKKIISGKSIKYCDEVCASRYRAKLHREKVAEERRKQEA